MRAEDDEVGRQAVRVYEDLLMDVWCLGRLERHRHAARGIDGEELPQLAHDALAVAAAISKGPRVCGSM